MTNFSPLSSTVPRFATASELEDSLSLLLGVATTPQLWTFFFDGSNELLEPIMPMDDHPAHPLERCATDDLGEVPFAHVYVARLRSISEIVGASSAVIVRERSGDAGCTTEDLEWARAIAHEFTTSPGLALRAQFILSDTGLRYLAPDDYA